MIHHYLKEHARNLIRCRKMAWQVVAILALRRQYLLKRRENLVVACFAIRINYIGKERQHQVTRTKIKFPHGYMLCSI